MVFFNKVFGLVRKESFLSFPAFVPGYRVVATGQVSPVSLTRRLFSLLTAWTVIHHLALPP